MRPASSRRKAHGLARVAQLLAVERRQPAVDRFEVSRRRGLLHQVNRRTLLHALGGLLLTPQARFSTATSTRHSGGG